MKIVLMSLLLGVLVATCGCARHYVIRLNNGAQITTSSKPRLKGASYYYKDSNGKPQAISAGRVAEIAPASMVKEEKAIFKPETR